MKESALTLKTLNNKIFRVSAFFLLFCHFSIPADAGTYSENLRYDLKRGAKNILSSPLEIMVTIQDYHERAGWPYVRQGLGLVVGVGKMGLRLGSGLVDLGAAWVPGLQKGLPVQPEVLF